MQSICHTICSPSDGKGTPLVISCLIILKRQRAAENNISDEITFEHANALIRDFEEGEFDVIYSRDCIIHIREKADLFARFYKWLKPGGRLVISGKKLQYF